MCRWIAGKFRKCSHFEFQALKSGSRRIRKLRFEDWERTEYRRSASRSKLKKLVEELKTHYRGRLAPSPTGYLHLGHARTFWTAQERARAHGGVLILRNEDLDSKTLNTICLGV